MQKQWYLKKNSVFDYRERHFHNTYFNNDLNISLELMIVVTYKNTVSITLHK